MNTLLGTDLSRRRLSSTMRIRLYYPLNEEEEVPPPGTPPLNIPPRLPAREPRQQPSGSHCRTLAETRRFVYIWPNSFSISFSLSGMCVRVCVCALRVRVLHLAPPTLHTRACAIYCGAVLGVWGVVE